MDTLIAFVMGQANRHKEPMVFDWDKAARLIVERGAAEASAGLAGDWEWTGGEIFSNGEPTAREDTYTYLSSTWATPELKIGGEFVECFRMQSEVPDWNEDTFWPESALSILGLFSAETSES